MAYNAVQLDGSDDALTGADVPLAKSSFTIAAWLKRDAANRNEYIVSQGSDAADSDLYMGFWSDNRFVCAFDTSNTLVTAAQYGDTDWHHWACSYDIGSGRRAVFRDGAPVAEDYLGSGDYYRGTGPLRIGRARWGNHLRGLLDEVAVWPDAMADADVELLYRKVKALDDSVTECIIGRTTYDDDVLDVHRTALRQTTTPLGRSEQELEDRITVDRTLPEAAVTSLGDDQHIRAFGVFPIAGEARDNTYVRSE